MIAIVGLGVIGGSYAMALKRIGVEPVVGIDRDERTLALALKRGLIEQGDADGADLLRRSKLVILALYPEQVLRFLRQHRDDFAPNCLITDATGVKGAIAAQAEALIREDVDFVPGHPMAGREKMGLDYASDRVFQGANYILTPLARNTEAHLVQVEALARAIGFRSVRRVAPEVHDAMIAHTSQLPHLIAVALINSDESHQETGRFIGDSYRDLTRIARINAALWSELFLENTAALLPVLDNFLLEMDRLRAALEAGDRETLLAQCRKSAERRERLDA